MGVDWGLVEISVIFPPYKLSDVLRKSIVLMMFITFRMLEMMNAFIVGIHKSVPTTKYCFVLVNFQGIYRSSIHSSMHAIRAALKRTELFSEIRT